MAGEKKGASVLGGGVYWGVGGAGVQGPGGRPSKHDRGSAEHQPRAQVMGARGSSKETRRAAKSIARLSAAGQGRRRSKGRPADNRHSDVSLTAQGANLTACSPTSTATNGHGRPGPVSPIVGWASGRTATHAARVGRLVTFGSLLTSRAGPRQPAGAVINSVAACRPSTEVGPPRPRSRAATRFRGEVQLAPRVPSRDYDSRTRVGPGRGGTPTGTDHVGNASRGRAHAQRAAGASFVPTQPRNESEKKPIVPYEHGAWIACRPAWFRNGGAAEGSRVGAHPRSPIAFRWALGEVG